MLQRPTIAVGVRRLVEPGKARMIPPGAGLTKQCPRRLVGQLELGSVRVRAKKLRNCFKQQLRISSINGLCRLI